MTYDLSAVGGEAFYDTDKNTVNIFQKTYNDYLEQIKGIRLDSIAHKLGARCEKNKLTITFFNAEYTVSVDKISDSAGKKPALDICVILSKYILLCPAIPPNDHQWVSYRNFKNSSPLVGYFKKEVEDAISSLYSDKIHTLKNSSASLAGYRPSLSANYDFVVQFDALPMIPIILLFNNADEEFPATCSILFESQAEKYLDCECLAMLGRQLFSHLKLPLNDNTAIP